jgi:hypothetical protein
VTEAGPLMIRPQPSWTAHMLKKYSGMYTMYFKLIVQRSTILIGKQAIN